MDRIELPIVSDQAQRVAQFRAGGIHTDVLAGNQENIVVTKREVPDVLLLQDDTFPVATGNMICFGWEQGSPWRDVRARQALSMMLDREAFIDVIDNRENFRKDGLELPVKINSAVPAGWGDYYLDPTNEKEFGPSAKYLRLDLAEAKKLLTAAGHPNGFEFNLNYGGHYGAAYNRVVEMYAGFFLEGGLRAKQTIITPSAVWLEQYSRVYRAATSAATGKGFDGAAVIPERTYATAAIQLYSQYHKDGGGYRGMVPSGGSVVTGDPKSNDLTAKIVQEFDRNKQKGLVHDLIRHEAEQQFYVPRVSVAKAFTLWWPAIGNIGAFNSYPGAAVWSDVRLNWWMDQTKPPLGKA
jgi:ABC-type transport system substrate-binding protein